MRRDFVWQKGAVQRQQQEHKDQEFAAMRQNVSSLLHQECAITSFNVQSLLRQLKPYTEHEEKLKQLAETLVTQCGSMPEESVEQLKMLVSESQLVLQTARQQLQAVEQANTQLVPKKAALQTAQTSFQEIEQQLMQFEETIKAINVAGLKKEKHLTALTQILQSTPERTYEEVAQAIGSAKTSLDELRRKEKQLPLRKKLQEGGVTSYKTQQNMIWMKYVNYMCAMPMLSEQHALLPQVKSLWKTIQPLMSLLSMRYRRLHLQSYYYQCLRGRKSFW